MRFVRACYWPTIHVLMMMSVVGCSAEAQRYIRFPNLASPGPAYAQRSDAIQHDPYPLNDIGPEIVGGRPLAYQQPLNEVARAKLVPSRPVLIQPSPVPGSTVYAPPVGSSPYAVAPSQPGAPLMPAPPMATSAQPVSGPPVVTSPFPAAPAPVAPSYLPSPTPMVTTSPFPATTAPSAASLPQRRAPY
jgi:hypothetical protein